jgi:hypothetical protein
MEFNFLKMTKVALKVKSSFPSQMKSKISQTTIDFQILSDFGFFNRFSKLFQIIAKNALFESHIS